MTKTFSCISLLLLVFLSVAHAYTTTTTIVQNPNQVALVINSKYNADDNSNGVWDTKDVVNWFQEAYPNWDSTNRVFRIRCNALTSGDNKGRTEWQYLHPDIDSAYYASGHVNTAVYDYILPMLDSLMSTTDGGLWGTVKYLVMVQGFPHKIDYNGMTATFGSAPDYYVRRSMDDAITTFLHQRSSVDTKYGDDWHMQLYRNSTTHNYDDAIHDALDTNATWGRFAGDGTIYIKQVEVATEDNRLFNLIGIDGSITVDGDKDSTPVYVLTTRLESKYIADVDSMIVRGKRASNYWYWNGSAMTRRGYDAVIDNNGDSLNPTQCGGGGTLDLDGKRIFYPWYSGTLRSKAISHFGYSNIDHDSSCSIAGSGYLWPVDSTFGVVANSLKLPTDTVILYKSAHAYNGLFTGGYEYPKNLASVLIANGLKIADGSWLWPPESSCAYSLLADTTSETSISASHPQGFIYRFINKGWTFASGTVWEPLASSIGGIQFYIEAMSQPNITFAEMAYVSEPINDRQNVHLGNPIATWYDSKNIPATISLTFYNASSSCGNDSVAGTFTVPNDGFTGSVQATCYYHYRASENFFSSAVTPSQSISVNCGSMKRWGFTTKSGGIDSLVFDLYYDDASYVHYKITP